MRLFWYRLVIPGAVALSLAPSGCGPIEVDECDEISHRDECEDADVEFGACYWVDVFTPTLDLTGCDPGQAQGKCIGFSGTQAGCASFECPQIMDRTIHAFEHDHGEIIDLFASPVCGPQPAGDWNECDPGQPSSACQCLCQIDGIGD